MKIKQQMMAVILVMQFGLQVQLSPWASLFRGLVCVSFLWCIIHNDPSQNHRHQPHQGRHPAELVRRYLLEEDVKDSVTFDQ